MRFRVAVRFGGVGVGAESVKKTNYSRRTKGFDHERSAAPVTFTLSFVYRVGYAQDADTAAQPPVFVLLVEAWSIIYDQTRTDSTASAR